MKDMNRLLLATACALMAVAAIGPTRARGEQGDIHEAARSGDLAAVHALIAKSPDLAGVRDGSGRTPLHLASAGGHVEVVAYLLSRSIDVDALDNTRRTPLHEAAAAGHDEISRLLIERKASIDSQDAEGETPLAKACGRGHLAVAGRLLAAGASVHATNAYGRTPLLLVARESGNAELARLLIDRKADLNARDKFGDTALGLAAWRGFRSVVDLLLERGAAIPGDTRARSLLLSQAAQGGLETLIARLMDAGVSVPPARPGHRSLLHDAAAGGSVRIIERVLAARSDINQADEDGWTPLHDAAFMERMDAIRFLLEKGADPNRRNRLGQSPWNVAVEHERASAADLLAARGADRSAPRFPVLEGDYLGQKSPGRDPEIFAPGIVGGHFDLHSTIVFSPDGSEAYWNEMVPRTGPGYSNSRTMMSRRVNGRWTYPEVAMVGGKTMGDVPVISGDGKRLYEMSRRALPGQAADSPKENIWFADRTGAGWGEPHPLDQTVNALPQHWQFAVDEEAGVYFSSNWKGARGLFYSPLVNGRHGDATPLGPTINVNGSEGMPFIAPDGSYLLFSRDMDIWISFRGPDGNWRTPTALPPPINTPDVEICPVVSPDGRYLFFLRGNVFWVDAGVIEEIRSGKVRESAAQALDSLITERGPEAAAAEYRKTVAGNARYLVVEREFITLGYRYLQSGRIREAMAVFEIATQALPDAWNTWDSLGEAYLLATWNPEFAKVADDLRAKAEASYAKSVALNPQNDNGRMALSRLRGAKLDAANETKATLRFAPGAQTHLNGPYLGQRAPGLRPELFAPGIVSAAGHFEFGITFSPDGKQVYFTQRRGEERNVLMVSRLEKDGWTAPEEAAFAEGHPAGEPHVTPDGRKLYFGSSRPRPGTEQAPSPGSIWVVERIGDGGWSEARYFGPGMYVSVARSGNLYMTDVGRLTGDGPPSAVVQRWTGTQYAAPQRLGGGVNSPAVADHSFISPDESYILFDSTRPGGQGGEGDLYVCFRRPDGSWSEAMNLGGAVNTPGTTFCPSVSPDGKYIFYTANRDIYWVSAEILEPLRARPLRGADHDARPGRLPNEVHDSEGARR
jgi:ankyrin repeat protein/Tol biopolymer transport system component